MPNNSGHPPSYLVERYENQIIEILNLMGRPDAFVRDDTAFFEIHHGGTNSLGWQDFIDVMQRMYGISVDKEDFIWEVAAQMSKLQ